MKQSLTVGAQLLWSGRYVCNNGRYGCTIVMSYIEINKAVSHWLLTFSLCVSVTCPLTCAFHLPCTHTPEISDMHRGVCDNKIIHDSVKIVLATNHSLYCFDDQALFKMANGSPRSPGGNTSPSPKVSAIVSRPVFNKLDRQCKRQGNNLIFTLYVLAQHSLYDQSMKRYRYVVKEFLVFFISVMLLSL